jgi:hypothetical protein
VRNTDDKAPHYVGFATLLPPNTSKAKISSSESYYRKASAYNPAPTFKAKSHTHTKQKAKLQFCVSLDFWIASWKTKASTPNDSKHSLTSICSQFLHGWNFYLLGLFPSVSNFPCFQRNYFQFLYCDFVPHSNLETPCTSLYQHSLLVQFPY